MRSSTPGRWGRRIGLPAAVMVAVALVGAPAFAATSTPSNPAPPPGCGVPGQPPKGPVTLPDPGKKCIVCIIRKDPGGGVRPGTAAGGDQGAPSPGQPGQCLTCPPPPGKPGPTGPVEGTGSVTLLGNGGPGAGEPGNGVTGVKCTICVIIKPGQPGGPITQPAPTPTQPVPGKPVKCGPLPGQK